MCLIYNVNMAVALIDFLLLHKMFSLYATCLFGENCNGQRLDHKFLFLYSWLVEYKQGSSEEPLAPTVFIIWVAGRNMFSYCHIHLLPRMLSLDFKYNWRHFHSYFVKLPEGFSLRRSDLTTKQMENVGTKRASLGLSGRGAFCKLKIVSTSQVISVK